ncbi:hypothetical protein, partial [Escherichia coli]|uniref:hypothetical protein n=1 Tax=Escherichia coli TaxID=562 RepID=UPI003EE2820B
FNALFFQRPAVNEAPFKAMLSHMFVVLHLPAFSQFPQLLFLLCVVVVQYIACGRWVQGVSSVLIRKIRRKRTYMFLSFVEK